MRLSIITINLNNKDGLDKTIRSVKSQKDFRWIEYIVIDGASTDGSVEVIEGLSEGLIWKSEPDNGIYNAMNKGAREAHGDYLLFLNSGDRLSNDQVVSDFINTDSDTDLIIGSIRHENCPETPPEHKKLTLMSLYEGYIPHPATFIRRELLMKNPYDESLKISADWKFFIQSIVLNNASYSYFDRTVSVFDENGISNTHPETGATERNSILHELFPNRIIEDYHRFAYGEGYEDTDYDKFFIEMRNYRYGKMFYTLAVFLMKIISVFRESAGFAKKYPGRI